MGQCHESALLLCEEVEVPDYSVHLIESDADLHLICQCVDFRVCGSRGHLPYFHLQVLVIGVEDMLELGYYSVWVHAYWCDCEASGEAVDSGFDFFLVGFESKCRS